jgi:hypothetical protein
MGFAPFTARAGQKRDHDRPQRRTRHWDRPHSLGAGVRSLVAWLAARIEVTQQTRAEQRDKAELPGEIVERMVKETDAAAEPAMVAAKEATDD